MDPVVYFEMPYENKDRVVKFYSSVFGWEMQALGEDMGSYVKATTFAAATRPAGPSGAINGGFYPKKPDWPAQFPSVVIAVSDIGASMKKVAAAGGKLLGDPMPIPGVGLYVSFFDTEGNRTSLLQPEPH